MASKRQVLVKSNKVSDANPPGSIGTGVSLILEMKPTMKLIAAPSKAKFAIAFIPHLLC
jgi:hypothetical protein